MFATPANLGIVAYAQVKFDGSTPDINSGVTVTLSSSTVPDMGTYTIKLPGGDANSNPDLQAPLQEGQKANPCRVLVFITPLQTDETYYLEQMDDYTFQVQFTPSLLTPAAFNLLILRSLISPPTDENGTQAPA
jgi:hypothetical protein